MLWNNIHGLIFIVIFSAAITLLSGQMDAADYEIHHNPKEYVLHKFQSHDLVMLGTRHRREPILQFISGLIPALPNAGVTHIGLEICSDQQGKIDPFIDTGIGLPEIEIHQQIDCPGYRNLLRQIQGLDENKRPAVVALDLPKSLYRGAIGRDEYMAESIAKVFQQMSVAKLLIVSGDNHVLKKLDWEDHVPNKTGSIRSYLDEIISGLSVFTIGQLIEVNPANCDFTRRFSQMDGSVAMDCDDSFSGWKIGLTSALAVNPIEPCELVDGVVVY